MMIVGFLRVEWIAYELERLARRMEAKHLNSPSDVEGGFVLYLRTFRTDRKAARFQYSKYDLEEERIAYTEEEFLCLTMERAYGQVVALGQPGEVLPQVGANRMYASNKQWHDWVAELASRASLVMIQVNEGKHTKWEIEHAAKYLPRDRVVLLVPRKIHEYNFLQDIFEYFATSPNLTEAYNKHIAAVLKPQTHHRGDIAEQEEYFSVICFDGAGVAFHDSVRWEKGRPAREQNLVTALALHTLFRLNHLPLWASLNRGLGNLACCRLSLTEPHSRMYCRRTDEQCLAESTKILQWNSTWPQFRVDSCCPGCLTQRRLSDGSK
ncbi:hypothetical protein PV387_29510 [Streptomyces sp. ME02-6987-2C]|uniref:hypothetical protein n=1 Tax=unclassified Streptomyces TaxID=2593676 RepID=UPI0029B79D44|nr:MULTISPECIES: hypothetical protein [unclassified Streptomyces]MDX3370115.1 hypothetical protein [Streptomyces sp. ME02-6987-2C]MDX3426042.1 hypothetical protein [Streptomyces sp. ME02-6985-2c]